MPRVVVGKEGEEGRADEMEVDHKDTTPCSATAAAQGGGPLSPQSPVRADLPPACAAAVNSNSTPTSSMSAPHQPDSPMSSSSASSAKRSVTQQRKRAASKCGRVSQLLSSEAHEGAGAEGAEDGAPHGPCEVKCLPPPLEGRLQSLHHCAVLLVAGRVVVVDPPACMHAYNSSRPGPRVDGCADVRWRG